MLVWLLNHLNSIVLKHFLIFIKLLPRKGKKFYYLLYNTTGVLARRKDYYLLAFQHKSLMMKDEKGLPLNNERLEYLGDAVLGAVIAHELFVRYPNKDEGILTKMRARIVNRSNMDRLALQLGLDKFIKTQALSDLTHTHIPGDALEALIGAIFIDKGYFAARKFIIEKIINQYQDLDSLIETNLNHKSTLIEWGQKNRCSIHFVTEEYPEKGEASFVAQAYIDNIIMGLGRGSSKKEAQQHAAEEALEKVIGKQSLILN